jgi:serine phosphatase RsbU (regulator of sigma subunit)
VLYTDGVPEATNPEGVMLEDEGFVRVLEEVATGSSTAICDHVTRRVVEFEKGQQSDDVTVLVLGRPDARGSTGV